MDGLGRASFAEASVPSSSLRRRCLASAANRSWARRSSTSSSDSASDGFPGVGERQTTCVARQTSGNDCALHSFVVWAAVKRNASIHMSLADKRRCPLLRCGDRFPSHELMLQHLYSCPHMVSGEYWCYDCGKVEQLGDVKCRRCCLGHASKRKKMLSMAKSFFGSLGHHKSRARGLADANMDVDDQVPPSYESVVAAVPAEAELQANEIYEADSLELAVPPVDKAQELYQADPFSAFFPPLAQQPVAPAQPSPQPSAALVPSPAGLDESLINWEPPLSSPPAASCGSANPSPVRAPERPVLQVNTHGLDHAQVRPPRRSKHLTPSSSIRSTSSATSTDSHDISPMSNWSGAWSRGPGFESTLTSPADDLTNLADLWPQTKHAGQGSAEQGHEASLPDFAPDSTLAELAAENVLLGLTADDFFAELATGNLQTELATDVPMLDHLGDGDTNSSDLDLQPDFAFDYTASSVTEPAYASLSFAMADEADSPLEPPRHQHVSASVLAQSARKTVQVHVESSIDRLRKDDETPLTREFCQMSPCSVAIAGLEAMVNVIEGRPETSPVRLLCFVHVLYSLSFMVHEQDAFRRSTQLFTQAVMYSCWLPHRDRQAYITVVGLLWQPGSMTDDDFEELQRTCLSRSEPESPSRKGKERAGIANRSRSDPLMLIAQHFLDDLEMTAVYDGVYDVRRPENEASKLYMEHLREGLLAPDRQDLSKIEDMVWSLALTYSEVPGFESAMQHVIDELGSGLAAMPRRLELHLVQAGKTLIPSSSSLDEYVLLVRGQIDLLYEQQTLGTAEADPRQKFYRLDIRLLMRLIAQKPEPGGEAFLDSSGGEGLAEALVSGRTMMTVDSFTELNSMTGSSVTTPVDTADVAAAVARAPLPEIAIHPPRPDEGKSAAVQTACTWPSRDTTAASPGAAASSRNTDNVSCCEICGYRPRGDPRWFGGSMAKHKKLQHGASPPTIYRCPYPGCNSQYRSRKDNLRQHQIDKNHFVDGDDGRGQRDGKRKRTG